MKTDRTVQVSVPPAPTPEAPSSKASFTPPKLTFIEPKLTKQGRVETITGLLGTQSP
ncbi:MAG: hypothetical protein KF832_08210 [Caldilineaceae bacterium]|nr:hypothetical protein [Caldilineaceae bacterium]